MEAITAVNKEWTILSLLEWSAEYLQEKGFESTRLNAELLLCHTLQCERIQLYTNFDKPLTPNELSVYKSYLKRRLSHEPVQYILGETEFMGLTLKVDKRVLIPRPETEILVEQVIELVKTIGAKSILDIGTGSGNIPVSLAKFINEIEIDSMDISKDALDVARSNADVHNVGNRIRFIHGDVHSYTDHLNNHSYDIIVSNPPYISSSEFTSVVSEVSEYEPSIATTDGGDGLTFYRTIQSAGKQLLKSNGWLIVEVAYNQSKEVAGLFASAGYKDIETISDYAGIERIVKARLS